jgi:hypothetical protein
MSAPTSQPIADSQRGQILAIFAGGLIVLLIAVGLVIDGGMAFFQRRAAQNQSDLASMAGTKVIADHYIKGGRTGTEVHDAIVASLAANGCAPSSPTPCTWTAEYVRPNGTSELDLGPVVDSGAIASGAQGVRVDVARLPRTFFLSLIDRPTWDVRTTATALTAAVDVLPPAQVLPIAANPPGSYDPNGVYQFSVGKDGPGNFGWLSWTGSNDAPTLGNSICTPDNTEITFPAWVDGDPGATNANVVRDCVQYWIDTQATVLIPIWGPGCSGDPDSDGVEGQGNSFEFCVVGLAAFVITAKSQPAIDELTGRFVEYYPLPTVPAGYGSAPGPGESVFFMGLVR